MDLPIVIRQPVTTADRWRWFFVAVVCVLLTGGMGLAYPLITQYEDWLALLLPSDLFRVGYGLVMLVLLVTAMNFLLKALFKADSTWTIDENNVTERLLFIGGRRTRRWPLKRIKKVRVREARDEGMRYYFVEV